MLAVIGGSYSFSDPAETRPKVSHFPGKSLVGLRDLLSIAGAHVDKLEIQPPGSFRISECSATILLSCEPYLLIGDPPQRMGRRGVFPVSGDREKLRRAAEGAALHARRDAHLCPAGFGKTTLY